MSKNFPTGCESATALKYRGYEGRKKNNARVKL